MKRILFAGAALVGLALPQQASAEGICFGFGFRACGPVCAPWYTHFPYDPHLYNPGPYTTYPHWPQRPTTGTRVDMPPVNAQMVNPYAQSGLRAVSYYGQGMPSYWYGR